jgi:hypothetical protein
MHARCRVAGNHAGGLSVNGDIVSALSGNMPHVGLGIALDEIHTPVVVWVAVD